MPAFQYIYCMTKISLNINSVHPSGVVVFHKVMYACSLGAAWVQWCWRITEEDVYQGVQHTTRGPESGPPGVSIRPAKPTRPTDTVHLDEYAE